MLPLTKITYCRDGQ